VLDRSSMNVEGIAIPRVRSYDPGHARLWDDLIARSCNGTFLHTRRFISYHGDRFRDRSLVLENHRGHIIGVFPAAEDDNDLEAISSHPGLTYGGLVHDGSVRGASMIGALERITGHYSDLGYRRLRYKVVPAIYHSAPADDDLYALFRLGATRYRSDLSAAIDLSHRGRVSQRRARSRRRAEGAGISVEETWCEIASFWRVLELNLANRHAASPVHSLEEIRLLHDRFPDQVLLIVARMGEVLAGGAVLYSAGPVLKLQYTATTEEGRALSATDLVMEHAIELARRRGCRYFDFGTCTFDEGHTLSQDMYQFKTSFGAGGVAYDHYQFDLGNIRTP
jgi:Acetyltransferase (GNAT) domain